jgi:trans-2-enoyl-CoA reductase
MSRIASVLMIHPGRSEGSRVALERHPLPDPGPGEALVRIAAAPIHPADLNSIEGKYPGTSGDPFPGGREGAGLIEAIGPGVRSLREGDTVLLQKPHGSWRDLIIAPESALFRVPAELSPVDAAMLRINPGTALRLLRDFAVLAPGDWIIQNAASSAVGRAVVQLAHHFDLRTVNLVRRPESVDEAMRAAGGVFLPDDGSADIRAAACGAPIRLGLNAVGGASALRLGNALDDGGTLVTYGAMARQPLHIPNGLLIFRGLEFRGFWLTRWTREHPPETCMAMLAELCDLAVRGILRHQVAAIYPLAEFDKALEHARGGGRDGKILFAPNGPGATGHPPLSAAKPSP